MLARLPILLLLTALPLFVSPRIQEAPAPIARQMSDSGVGHSVLALGAETFLLDAGGRTVWSDPRNTRDGWMLPDGNLLLVITKSAEYPGGGVVEVTRDGKTLFEYKGTQSEVNTAQPLAGGRLLISEAGPNPRLLEIDRKGKVLIEVPVKCQTSDFHMQVRMCRKLKNGHYLVPQLLEEVVREYDKNGLIVWEAKTPNWPFAAIRLDNGNTLISCTRGNMVTEVDSAGKTVWQVTNEDLPGAPLKDCCGMQRLPNGNTVITSYGAGGTGDVKLTEVTPAKKTVWTLLTGRAHGIHEFQILDDGGRPLKKTLR